MAFTDDLAEIVDDPSETLAVEYKSKLNFSDPKSKADFARHAAALTNHGGGYIVFGFNDNLSRCEETEFPEITRDSVAGIIKAYLTPPFHCDVRVVNARSGSRHTVVVIPPHGAVPVCTRRGGPADHNGQPQGIRNTTYYIRKPGPSSEPIIAPAEWAPLIRRCALAERASILAAIDTALASRRTDVMHDARDSDDVLRKWHEALMQSYIERVPSILDHRLLGYGHMQFSFIVHHKNQPLAYDNLIPVISRCNAEADAVTKIHWGPFVVMHHQSEFGPRSRTDPKIENGEREFTEAAVIGTTNVGDLAEIWRVSPDGFASLIKGWWEDTPHFSEKPGKYISPNWLSKEVSGFVLFARAFANSLETATAVSFICEWTGLKGRIAYDPNARWQLRPKMIEDDRRISQMNFPLTELNSSWEVPSAALSGSVARAAGVGQVMDAAWFAKQAKIWLQQP